MNEFLDWIEHHEDKLKIASLIVAVLVFVMSLYRWLLQRWRADVSLRQYAYLHPIEGGVLEALTRLCIDIPVAQELRLELHSERGEELLHEGQAMAGLFEYSLDMGARPAGEYSLKLITPDQTVVKRLRWSG